MKKEIYICDLCKEEIRSPRKGEKKVQVIFTTEQEQGITIKQPYFELVDLDWCEQCKTKALNGKAIFASGAMGYNKYYFKD